MNAKPGPDFLMGNDGIIRNRTRIETIAANELQNEEQRRAINKAKRRLKKQRHPWWRKWLP